MMKPKENSNLLEFNLLAPYDSLTHFSTTIEGGVSEGTYTSFNLGEYSGDNLSNVTKNHKTLAEELNVNINDLFLPYQTHRDNILLIDELFLSKTESQKKELLNGVDALLTNCKDICIGITTADCVPVIIYDPQNGVLGVAHAGWRGTVAHIGAKLGRLMIDKFNSNPQTLIVGIAPSISQEYFEVGDEVVKAFKEGGFAIDEIAHKNPVTRKIHINLPLANALQLQEIGVLSQNIEMSGLCTFSNSEQFFSARRQGLKSGRMVTGGILR